MIFQFSLTGNVSHLNINEKGTHIGKRVLITLRLMMTALATNAAI